MLWVRYLLLLDEIQSFAPVAGATTNSINTKSTTLNHTVLMPQRLASPLFPFWEIDFEHTVRLG